MPLKKNNDKEFWVMCDDCDDTHIVSATSGVEVRDGLRTEGWEIRMVDDIWIYICPDCK